METLILFCFLQHSLTSLSQNYCLLSIVKTTLIAPYLLLFRQ
ncbi:hypothetical protein PTUN_a1123 [Pseudoalteromonas tunicata]|nr:hypothetical protein PTUN_a1123 [Pseudoalteromonas tunicata]